MSPLSSINTNNDKNKNKKFLKFTLLASLGGTLEFFDFAIYALFSPYIAQVFFPGNSHINALLLTFSIFAAGYLARPLGGLIFGHIGDRFGRRHAFSHSIIIMAIGTMCIGLLPSYHHIGITAPLLLMLLRIIQGVSLGGEIPGSSIFTAEHLFNQNRSGMAIGMIFMFITLGNTLGGFIGAVLTHYFTPEQMLSFGWRIPFIIGFAIGIIAYFMRKNINETPVFQQMKTLKQPARPAQIHTAKTLPLLQLIKDKPYSLLIALSLTALPAVTVSFILYLPTYLSYLNQPELITNTTSLNSSNHMYQHYIATTFSFFIYALGSMIFGALSDKLGRKCVMLIGCILTILVCGLIINKSNLTHLSKSSTEIIFAIILPLSVSLINGVYAISIIELFPSPIRSSGMGLSYNLGYAMIGGTAPLLFTFSIQTTKQSTAPLYLIMLYSLITLIGLYNYQSHFKTQFT
ncbi:Proline porter II [Piscirickettsia salmonis]|nr:Proline porter II [Piscirickettsia salmonis]